MSAIGISYNKMSSKDKALLRDEIGKCQLCDNVERLVIDHCHETGLVRGVLCGSCNLKIGWVEGLNHHWVSLAAGYLQVDRKPYEQTTEYQLLKLLQARFRRDNQKWIDEAQALEKRRRELDAELIKIEVRCEVIEARLGEKRRKIR